MFNNTFVLRENERGPDMRHENYNQERTRREEEKEERKLVVFRTERRENQKTE